MRRHWIWLVLGGAVAGLVALNLALREDPEPDLGTYEPPAARPSDTTIVVPNPEDLEGRVPIEGLEGEEAGEAAPIDEGDDVVEAEACEHPFVPSSAGQWRRYRWTQSDQEREAVLRIEARRARRLDDEVQVLWLARVIATDDDSELARADLITRCVPGESSEEPWFGILERSLGLRLTARAGRWRWPAALTPGLRFRGTATFDPRQADMRPPDGVTEPSLLRVTRRHVVERQETIEVPAGRFEAWRVEYEESQQFGEHGETGRGVQWVAPEVGLVKLEAENSQGITQTVVLERLGPE